MMIRTIGAIALSMSLLGMNSLAFAGQGANYFGIYGSYSGFRQDAVGGVSVPKYGMWGGGLKYGRDFTRHFAGEVHLLFPSSDTNDFGGNPVSLDVNYALSVFARGNLLFDNDRVQLYGLLGLTHAKGSASGSGIALNGRKTGVSYGVGVELYGNASTAVNLEWIQLLKKSDFDYQTINLGFVHHF